MKRQKLTRKVQTVKVIHRKKSRLRNLKKLKILQEKTEAQRIQTEMMSRRMTLRNQNLTARAELKKMTHQTVHLQKRTQLPLILKTQTVKIVCLPTRIQMSLKNQSQQELVSM